MLNKTKTISTPSKKVKVKDREQSIDLQTGDGGDEEFWRSHIDKEPELKVDDIASNDESSLEREEGKQNSQNSVIDEVDEADETKSLAGNNDGTRLVVEVVSILDLDQEGSVYLEKDSEYND